MPVLQRFRILIHRHARSIGLIYDNRYSLPILKTVVNFTANMKNLHHNQYYNYCKWAPISVDSK